MTNSNQMRQYLLGTMAEEDRVKLEESYFTDADKFDEVLAAENDLVDAYVRDELPNAERGLFEKQYGAIPEKRSKVEFARALTHLSYERSTRAQAVDKTSVWESIRIFFAGSNPSLRLAFLSGAAVVIVGTSWLAIQNRHLRTELSRTEAKQEQLQQSEEKLRQQIADTQSGQPTPKNEEAMQVAELNKEQWPELTLRLVPGSVRSAGNAVVLHLPSGRSWIRLEMETGDRYPNYETVLQTAEGQEVYRRTIPGSTSRNQQIILRLPSNLIHPGDYVVRLNGKDIAEARTEEIEDYTFRVVQP